MIYIKDENADYMIEGYMSCPEIHRSSRNHMITLVNGRVVKNVELNKTINDSYHSYKPDNRYPIVVLNILVDTSLVDVNIHPTKMDIKFSKMEELTFLITKMIREKLETKTFIPKIEIKEEPKKIEEISLFLERNNENPYINEENTLFVNEDIVSLEEPTTSVPKERMPELYPVGLVHGTYIICQNDLGMYLMDQHAAKERINYEKYLKEFGNPSSSKISMLFPLTIELTNQEFIILKENMDLLRNYQFDIEEFGINSIIIKAHPIWLPKGMEDEAIKRIIELILQKEKNFSIEKFNESLATMLSCKLAIKANMNITLEEMEQLVNDLRKCNNPFNCPHGRPTTIFYSNYDLEKLFKRSGFENNL